MPFYILSIVMAAVSLFISFQVQSQFRKYSHVAARYSGAEAAQIILRSQGINDVEIARIRGTLTDNYNPTNKVLALSDEVFAARTVSAVAVAAHECGHAIQHARGYAPLNLRKKMVPAVNFTSTASYIIIALGVFMEKSGLITIGAILFSAIVLFNLVTLPVEVDASNRALKLVDQLDLIDSANRSSGAKVLRIAGMTYFISLLYSMLTLMRYLSLASNSRRRD